MEVISASSRKYDMVTKLNKYMHAGVSEYWIIDPEQQMVLVYDFERPDFPQSYTFEDAISIGVLDNQCIIDFKKLFQYVSFLYKDD